MTVLTDRTVWSRSQMALLRECSRKYFFQKSDLPQNDQGELASPWESILHLRKLTNRYLWSGGIVHETMGELLRTLRQGQPLPTLEDTVQKVQARMREEFRLSLKEPSTLHRLIEHEYNLPISKEIWKRQWDQVELSLRKFYSSAWLDRLQILGPECWKAVDEILSFDVDGVQAYVKIDCAIEKDGVFTLIDWKTGSLKFLDTASLQVAALYAHEVWGADPSAINPIAVSLPEGQSQKIPIDEDILMETYMRIGEEAAEIQKNAEVQNSDPFTLPSASNPQSCQKCNFQKLCFPQGLDRAV